MHLTVVFVGYASNEETLKICQMTKKAAEQYESFNLNFQRICLGPPRKPPRLIWLEGEKNQALIALKKELEKNLVGAARNFRSEYRDLMPHITLARIKQMEWQRLQQKPEIEEAVDFNVLVNSIEVMESELKRTGPEYTVLELVQLK